MSTVLLLHPGQMGAAVGAEVVAAGSRVLWCPEGRSARTRQRADEAGLVSPSDGTLGSALAEADIVLSVCPPANAVEVAESVAALGFAGLYVDANAISPQHVDDVAATVTARGASFVDGCIIGPPPTERTRARFYLSGDKEAASTVAALLTGTQVETTVLDKAAGAASALKMAFSSFQKVSRVLVATAHALAAEFDVTEHLTAEGHRMSGGLLADTAFLPSVAARAWRWAPEMHEIAATLEGVGLPPQLVEAAAEVMRCWEGDKDTELPLAEVLAHLHTAHGGATIRRSHE